MKTIEERSKYFIGGNRERSEQVYFSLYEAKNGNHERIDCMDIYGKYLGTYSMVGDYYTEEWI